MNKNQKLLKRIKKLQRRLLRDAPVGKCSIVYSSMLRTFKKKIVKNKEVISSYWTLNRLEEYLDEVKIFTSQFRRPKSRDSLNDSHCSTNKSNGNQNNSPFIGDKENRKTLLCSTDYTGENCTVKLSMILENMNNVQTNHSDASMSLGASPFRPPLPLYTPPLIPSPPPLPYLPAPPSPPPNILLSEATPSPARIPCESSSRQLPTHFRLQDNQPEQCSPLLVQPQYDQTSEQNQFCKPVLKQHSQCYQWQSEPSPFSRSFGQAKCNETLDHLNSGTSSSWLQYRSSDQTRYRPPFDGSLITFSESDRIDRDELPCENFGGVELGRDRFTMNTLVVIMEDMAEGMKSLTISRSYWIKSCAKGNYLLCNRGKASNQSAKERSVGQRNFGKFSTQSDAPFSWLVDSNRFPRGQSPWQPQFFKRMPIKSLNSRLQRLQKKQQGCSKPQYLNLLSLSSNRSTRQSESRSQPHFDRQYGEVSASEKRYPAGQKSSNSQQDLRTSVDCIDRPVGRMRARCQKYPQHDRLVTAFAFDKMKALERRIKSSTEMYSPLENLYGNVKSDGRCSSWPKIPKITKSTKTKVAINDRNTEHLSRTNVSKNCAVEEENWDNLITPSSLNNTEMKKLQVDNIVKSPVNIDIRSNANSEVTDNPNSSTYASLPERRSEISEPEENWDNLLTSFSNVVTEISAEKESLQLDNIVKSPVNIVIRSNANSEVTDNPNSSPSAALPEHRVSILDAQNCDNFLSDTPNENSILAKTAASSSRIVTETNAQEDLQMIASSVGKNSDNIEKSSSPSSNNSDLKVSAERTPSKMVSNMPDPDNQKNILSKTKQNVPYSPSSTIIIDIDLDESDDEVSAVKVLRKPRRLKELDLLKKDIDMWCGTKSLLSNVRATRASREKLQPVFNESPLDEKLQFKCTICRKLYTSIKNLRRHKNRIHRNSCSLSNVSHPSKRRIDTDPEHSYAASIKKCRTEIELTHSYAKKKNEFAVIDQKPKKNRFTNPASWIMYPAQPLQKSRLEPRVLLKKIDLSCVVQKVTETSEDYVKQTDLEVSRVDNLLSEMNVSFLDNMLSNFNVSCVNQVANETEFDINEFLEIELN